MSCLSPVGSGAACLTCRVGSGLVTCRVGSGLRSERDIAPALDVVPQLVLDLEVGEARSIVALTKSHKPWQI